MPKTEVWEPGKDMVSHLLILEYSDDAYPEFIKDEPLIEGKRYYSIGLVERLSVKTGELGSELVIHRREFTQFPGLGLAELMDKAKAVVLVQEEGHHERRFKFMGACLVEETAAVGVTAVKVTVPVRESMVRIGLLPFIQKHYMER